MLTTDKYPHKCIYLEMFISKHIHILANLIVFAHMQILNMITYCNNPLKKDTDNHAG